MEANEQIQEAARLLKEEEKNRVEQCNKEMQAVLKKYECMMVPQIIIRGDQISSQVLIYSKKDKSK